MAKNNTTYMYNVHAMHAHVNVSSLVWRLPDNTHEMLKVCSRVQKIVLLGGGGELKIMANTLRHPSLT